MEDVPGTLAHTVLNRVLTVCEGALLWHAGFNFNVGVGGGRRGGTSIIITLSSLDWLCALAGQAL